MSIVLLDGQDATSLIQRPLARWKHLIFACSRATGILSCIPVAVSPSDGEFERTDPEEGEPRNSLRCGRKLSQAELGRAAGLPADLGRLVACPGWFRTSNGGGERIILSNY
eukprot:6202500-Pleurochrysis_carterae.AAC.2